MESKIITKKGTKLYFDLDEHYFEINYVKFLWQKRIAKIKCNSDIVGTIKKGVRQRSIFNPNCSYEINYFKDDYTAFKNSSGWQMKVINDTLSFSFKNNKDFLIFFNGRKIGKGVYNLSLSNRFVKIELIEEYRKYYFQTILLFSVLSGHRYIKSQEGDLFASKIDGL